MNNSVPQMSFAVVQSIVTRCTRRPKYDYWTCHLREFLYLHDLCRVKVAYKIFEANICRGKNTKNALGLGISYTFSILYISLNSNPIRKLKTRSHTL